VTEYEPTSTRFSTAGAHGSTELPGSSVGPATRRPPSDLEPRAPVQSLGQHARASAGSASTTAARTACRRGARSRRGCRIGPRAENSLAGSGESRSLTLMALNEQPQFAHHPERPHADPMLDAAAVEAVARRVVELMCASDESPSGRWLVDAGALAVRIGTGPKPRLRLDLQTARVALARDDGTQPQSTGCQRPSRCCWPACTSQASSDKARSTTRSGAGRTTATGSIVNDRQFADDRAVFALRPVLYSPGVQHSAPALLMQPGAWHRELEAPGASDTLPSQSGRLPR
jgi:hypothetical protein